MRPNLPCPPPSPFRWVCSKYFLNNNIWYYKIIFNSTTLMLSLKLSFMTANYCVNILIVFTEAFVIVCQMTQCNVLTVQCFYLRRNNGSLFLLSTRNKRVAITFHKNHTLNIGNQYHKDAPKIFCILSFWNEGSIFCPFIQSSFYKIHPTVMCH